MPSPSRSHHPDPAFATTLAHGLSVLQSFTRANLVMSNAELAERTGLSKATISRLTNTLVQRGLLIYDARLRRYRLAPAVLALSYPLLADMKLRQLARPWMKKLADRSGGSVSMGIRDGMHMVYVETCRGHDAMLFRPDIGARLPLLASAMGRAWLAQANSATRTDVLERLRSDDAQTWQHLAPAWEQALADFEAHGFSMSLGDWLADVHAVAVPMRSPVDGQILVFNCGIPIGRGGATKLRSRIAPQLVRMVRKIELLCDRGIGSQHLATTSAKQAAMPAGAGSPPGQALPGEPGASTTLAHGIDILACFRADRPSLANRDFVQQTGLSKSAVARLTHTLVALGYLQHDTHNARYRLGGAALAMCYPLLAGMPIRQIARPLMKQLADHARGAVSLVVRDRAQLIYVETARSNEALQTRPDIGAALPLLSSAAGKAWLSRVSDEERAIALNQLRVADPNQYEKHIGTLSTARRDLERKGYCGNNQQWRADAFGFAAPLFKPCDSLLYVVNCGVPSGDGPYHLRAADIGPRLVTLAREIETLLGMR